MEKQTKKLKLNAKKVETVAKLKEKLEKTKALFLADYRGLTHQQLESLRKTLKKIGAEFVVAKNTLLKIAIRQLDNKAIEQLEPKLKNPTATLFAFGDEIAAIKEVARFIKSVQLPKIKIGFFAGKIATEADFQKLATIPTRDVLLATLVIRLKSPLYGLHYALRWNIQRLATVLENIKGKKPITNN